LAEKIRSLAIRAIRAAPELRGRGRLSALLNRALLKAGADPIMVCDMVAGHRMRIDCRIYSHGHVAFSGHYDDAKIETLGSFLRPGDVALDIGANIGFYTVPLALMARKAGAHVIAVEPFPNNVEWLRDNLRLNGAKDAVDVVPIALSDHAGSSRLVLTDDFIAGANVGNAAIDSDDLYDQNLQRVSVPVETLDALWPKLTARGVLRVVKLDIEGREALFLSGSQTTLSRYRPVILMEVNRWFYQRRGQDFDSLIMSLLPAGYEVFELRGSRLVSVSDLSRCYERDAFLVPAELADHVVQSRQIGHRPQTGKS
jgi:FkbM family methyltransferase